MEELIQLDRIEAHIAWVEAHIVTKTDLAETIGVEVAATNRLVRQTAGGLDNLRSEMRVLTATVRQLVATVGGLADIIQALADNQTKLDDRLRRLEGET